MLLAQPSDPMHAYIGVPVTLPRSRKAAEREWRNRQTRTVQVRVLERVWGFNSPLAHKKWCALRGESTIVLFRVLFVPN